MEPNCELHPKQKAIFYCADHAILCCGEDKCYYTHAKHNTVLIKKYNEVCSSLQKYQQLQDAATTLPQAKAQICNALNDALGSIKKQVETYEAHNDFQIMKQLIEKKVAIPFAVNDSSEDLTNALENFCTAIKAFKGSCEYAPNRNAINNDRVINSKIEPYIQVAPAENKKSPINSIASKHLTEVKNAIIRRYLFDEFVLFNIRMGGKAR